MALGEYLVGSAFLGVELAAAGATAWLIHERWPTSDGGVTRTVALGILATIAVIAAHLLPGMLGVLSRETVLIAALLLAGVAWLWTRRGSSSDAPTRAEPKPDEVSRPASWVIAVAGAGAVTLFSVASGHFHAPIPPANVDALAFHLPDIGRWIQEGSLWRIDQFLPLIPTGQYPHHGDVLLMAAMLPWENDAFVRSVNFVFLGLAGLAIFAAARELRAPRSTSVLFAALAVSLPAVTIAATHQVMTDPPLLASFSAALLFLLRHRRTEARSDLILAGLGLGVAFGTKWYGPPSVAAVIGVLMAAWLVAGRRPLPVLRRGGALIALVLLVGGFWLLRNWVGSGNPLYPVRLSVLGVSVLDAPVSPVLESTGLTIAHYVSDPSVWGDWLIPAFARRLGAGAAVLLLGVALALGLYLRDRRRGQPTDHAVPAGSMLVILLLIVYALTPGSAAGPEGFPFLTEFNVRYAVPAFLVAAPLAAWGVGRAGRGRLPLEVLALVGVFDGIRRGFEPLLDGGGPGAYVVAIGALTVAGLAWGLAVGRRPGAGNGARTPRMAAVGFAVTLAIVAYGYRAERKFNGDRYEGIDPTFDVVVADAPTGRRVGVAGTWDQQGYAPTWPMFGPRIGNVVEYVGPVEDGLLREFRGRDQFAAALRSGGYDLVLIGRGDPAKPEVVEERWARSVGFREVASSERFALFESGSR